MKALLEDYQALSGTSVLGGLFFKLKPICSFSI